MKPEVGHTYKDHAGRTLTVTELDEASGVGREVVGRVMFPAGDVHDYSCSLIVFQRIWVDQTPELKPPKGNAGGARSDR